MANVKISNLTAASTPLAGTEVLPIVQSGATVKASIANVQTATYSGGTANGVAYLNGSKVLTTGSSLTFSGSALAVTGTASATTFYPTVTSGTGIQMTSTGNNNGNWTIANNYGQMTIATEGAAGSLVTGSSQGAALFGNSSNVPAQFFTNNTVRATIDTSGNLLVGESTATGNPLRGMQVLINSGQTSIVMGHVTGTTSGTQYLGFNFNGSVIGSITQSGTTAVLYNVTSDYRLKTVTNAVTGQGARIDALKPIDYQWKESNEQARGFLAHEFQEVYPSSVSGNKDAIDKDGKPAYQSMQASTSEVIADLVAEIQSLRKRLAAAGI
jgi:hypothetical protein